ncbi:Trichothecene C-15 hydroxylase [Penicillium canescens]|uniref:Trichothecene C-15 hydroxylase n=1 Tax=Penicillium canescens TaxID=5083 RepID=A0AAD6I2L8_PENCN|nr:Trichothecene C-15 hydroxylase [Penicillium canescens]KAJ6027337.1 Trichothecene C-15 hydroxylase [Penicillium canescens]KAJ6040620.1 Trichothecene C-15 hydroxylase [Penicillium canescens]KAJ6067028.1 Trichothecene C-15 hydroxylase [Penicillium canescens]KAJ6101262.1 Trichothecene C-15 hydroxylase [Penicillium canescens]KAJ6173720.1 Trichothecene C-15 hydroxylase [Penicillium canescens]
MPTVTSFLVLLGTLIFGYGITSAFYNVFLHPLRGFPGPKLWAVSPLPAALNILRGMPHRRILELHNEYGSVVRVGPNELAFAHADAWKDICGHLKRGQAENGKDPKYLNEETDKSLISASRERHGPLRRTLAHAFSARAMAEQQPLINSFIDLFLRRLREHGENGMKPINMTQWYEWTTFDIIGNLAFGESFGCLQNSKSHPWVDILFASMKFIPLMQVLHDLPFFNALKPILLALLMPSEVVKNRQATINFSREALRKRLNLGITRPDFVDAMLKPGAEHKMSELEMIDTSVLLTTAGSETTATTLTATTYFLCTNPDVLTKLNTEVRSAFKSEDEIDLHSVQNLTYMLSVLKESMRVYPPVPIALSRRSPPGGTQIAGQYVAGGTTLGIWQYALYHSASNFAQPDSFIPDRWLGNVCFESDHKDLHQPFSYGPRNCIGMNLAYTEMRLILARIVWNFDLELAPNSIGWADNQKIFFFWNKPPLNVFMKPRGC